MVITKKFELIPDVTRFKKLIAGLCSEKFYGQILSAKFLKSLMSFHSESVHSVSQVIEQIGSSFNKQAIKARRKLLKFLLFRENLVAKKQKFLKHVIKEMIFLIYFEVVFIA